MIARRQPLSRHRAAAARSAPLKNRSRVGTAAAARRKAGGAIVTHRPAETIQGYRKLREDLIERSGGYDEVMGAPLKGTDVAHVIARSQGGADDLTNVLWLARRTHRLMEAPYSKGRLVVTRITVNGVRGFDWEYVSAADKFAYRRGEFIVLKAGFIAA